MPSNAHNWPCVTFSTHVAQSEPHDSMTDDMHNLPIKLHWNPDPEGHKRSQSRHLVATWTPKKKHRSSGSFCSSVACHTSKIRPPEYPRSLYRWIWWVQAGTGGFQWWVLEGHSEMQKLVKDGQSIKCPICSLVTQNIRCGEMGLITKSDSLQEPRRYRSKLMFVCIFTCIIYLWMHYIRRHKCQRTVSEMLIQNKVKLCAKMQSKEADRLCENPLYQRLSK